MIETLKTLYFIGRKNATDEGQVLIGKLSQAINSIVGTRVRQDVESQIGEMHLVARTDFIQPEEVLDSIPERLKDLIGDRLRGKIYQLTHGSERLKIRHVNPGLSTALYYPHVPTRFFTRNGLPCSIFDYQDFISALTTKK